MIAALTHWRLVRHHIEPSQLICWVNQFITSLVVIRHFPHARKSFNGKVKNTKEINWVQLNLCFLDFYNLPVKKQKEKKEKKQSNFLLSNFAVNQKSEAVTRGCSVKMVFLKMLIKLELHEISLSDNVEIKKKTKKLTDFILFLVQNTFFVQRRISVYENTKGHLMVWFWYA